MQDETAKALNRIADALFQQAKASRLSAKSAERQADATEVMLAVQQQNLATTKALEEQLIRAQGGSANTPTPYSTQ